MIRAFISAFSAACRIRRDFAAEGASELFDTTHINGHAWPNADAFAMKMMAALFSLR